MIQFHFHCLLSGWQTMLGELPECCDISPISGTVCVCVCVRAHACMHGCVCVCVCECEIIVM